MKPTKVLLTPAEAADVLMAVEQAQSNGFGTENLVAAYEKLEEYVLDHVCEWCGELENDEQGPVVETIVSPPVDGYRPESIRAHKDCAYRVAENMVI